MATETVSTTSADGEPRDSWLPMIVIAMAQILMSFNVNALPVSIGGIVASFDAPPTVVGTAIVTYSLFIAGFVMLGAKIGALFGSRSVFQAMVALFGAAMATMTLSPSANMMIAAQGIAGVAAAALVPTLVVLIATNYKGRQQSQALGWLAAAEAMAGVLAFLVAGSLSAWIGWRYSFALLVVLAGGVLALSRELKPVASESDMRIDGVGTVLAALAVILISTGFNNINTWGLLLARPAAPVGLLGLSPAPLMIVVGTALGKAFFAWSKKRQAAQKTPLLAVELLETSQQRSVVFSMFVIVALGSAVSFLIPLYIQIVQGRSSVQTALAIIPYSLSILAAAILVSRLYDRLTSRYIARFAFAVVAAGLVLLAVVIRNEWETFMVIFGLIVVGLGQGALVALLFNVLSATSRKELAGDVGSLRGTANNLGGAVGTGIAGALLIGVLTVNITMNLTDNPAIPKELKAQVDLDKVDFVSNDRLLMALERTTAAPDQKAEAVRINTQSRLQALKISMFVLACMALVAIFPSSSLPDSVDARPRQDECRLDP